MGINTAAVQRLYVAYFNRPADPVGLAHWEAQLGTTAATQAQLTTLAGTGFSGSAEYAALYAGQSDAQIVNNLYLNLFGRSAETAGLVHWAGRLTAGTETFASIALQLTYSAQGTDATAIANKLSAATSFTTALDTAAEIIGYSGTAAAASGRTYLAAVTDVAATLTTATAAAALAASVSAAVAAGTASAGSTFTLTTGIDTLTGTSSDDTFNAAGTSALPAFSALDSVAGGIGTDTLNWTQTGAAVTATPAGTTVTGVEKVNLTVDAFAITLDTTTSAAGFTGLTTLTTTNAAAAQTITTATTVDVTVTDAGQAATAVAVNGGKAVTVNSTGVTAAGGTITIGAATAATGAVTVSDTAQAMLNGVTAGAIAVTGGTTVNVTQTTTGAGLAVNESATQGAVTVTGTAATTTVSVIQSGNVTAAASVALSANANNLVAGLKGNVAGAVTIADANAGSTVTAATITAVTLQNFDNSTISSNKLATLTLSGTGVDAAGTANITGTLGLTDGLTTPTVTALALNLGGGSIGAITDSSNKFTTVNAVLTANTKLASFADTALRTLAISGTGVLTLTATNAALTSVTVAGAAGFSGTLVGTGVTSFTAANTTANNTVTLTSTTQAYTGGTGNDKVTIAADATQVITGGGGTGTDTLALGAVAGSTFTLANTGTKVTGFETLLTTATTGTVDMSLIGGSAFTKIQVAGNSSTTFSKVTAGTALELQAATTAIVYTTSDTAGSTDTVALTLTGIAATAGTGTKGYTTTALTLTDLNSVGIGTVNVVTDASVSGGIHTISTLTDSALHNLAITGTGSLTISASASTATTLTISDNDTSTGLSALTAHTSTGNVLGNIAYSGTHAFAITTLTDNVANATVTNANTGTTGVLTIGTWSDANMAGLTLNGSVALTSGTFALNGAATFSGATDNQIVNITASGGGVKTVTLGNGADTIVTGAAADVITLGTGANSVTGLAGGDTVTFSTTHSGVDTVIYTAAAQTFAAAVTSGTTALTAAAGADIYTGLKAGDTINLTAITADLYVNTFGTSAVLAAGGTGDFSLLKGGYVAGTGIFTISSSGTDSILQWDSNGSAAAGNVETVVLVGFAGTASSTTDGLITLA